MKKILGLILIIAVLMTCCMTIFVACDNAVDYEHTIIFYTSQGDALQKITQNAINSFEAKYPGWKVQHVQAGGYDDVKEKIVSDFQGKQQPDLAYCYADHVAQYLQTGKVYDLNSLIYSEETVTDGSGNLVTVGFTEDEIADFIEGYWKEGYAENYSNYDKYGFSSESMLTLPFVKSTELMYYNQTVLDEFGFTAAETWDDLWEQCEAIKDKYPEVTPLAYDSEANWFITMCQQNGWDYTSVEDGNHYQFNNADTIAWLTELSGYYANKYITTEELYGSYTSDLFKKGTNAGAIYCIGSSGGASYQNPGTAFKYGIAPIPSSGSEDGQNAAISQGPSLVMLEAGYGVENIDEKKIMTFLFVKELLDPTFQASFAIASGYIPCRESVFDVQAYVDHMDEGSITAEAAKVARSMTDRYFTSPAFVGSSTARTQVGNVMQYALTGRKTPEKALADAVANCGGNK